MESQIFRYFQGITFKIILIKFNKTKLKANNVNLIMRLSITIYKKNKEYLLQIKILT